jgi:hypothetical protein
MFGGVLLPQLIESMAMWYKKIGQHELVYVEEFVDNICGFTFRSFI